MTNLTGTPKRRLNMTRFANQTPRNAAKLDYRTLLNETTALVSKAYPSLSRDNAQYVADLMVRHDEDVIEVNGQFINASEADQLRAEGMEVELS